MRKIIIKLFYFSTSRFTTLISPVYHTIMQQWLDDYIDQHHNKKKSLKQKFNYGINSLHIYRYIITRISTASSPQSIASRNHHRKLWRSDDNRNNGDSWNDINYNGIKYHHIRHKQVSKIIVCRWSLQ